ncbi:unnamed protein product, partial [Prorocentrum cordatum]
RGGAGAPRMRGAGPRRSSQRRGLSGSAGLLLRCGLFWATPVSFLLLEIAEKEAEGSTGTDSVVAALPALAALLLVASCNLAADCFLRCGGYLLLLQVPLQLALVLRYASGQHLWPPDEAPGAAAGIPQEALAIQHPGPGPRAAGRPRGSRRRRRARAGSRWCCPA